MASLRPLTRLPRLRQASSCRYNTTSSSTLKSTFHKLSSSPIRDPSARSIRPNIPKRIYWTGSPRTMPLEKAAYLSNVWKDGLFKDKVVFCTGGNGSICSAQVRALVHLGANACIVGRNVEKTEGMAKDIATARPGSKVIGIGAVDVRSVESLQNSIDTCVKELGGIDFLMCVKHSANSLPSTQRK